MTILLTSKWSGSSKLPQSQTYASSRGGGGEGSLCKSKKKKEKCRSAEKTSSPLPGGFASHDWTAKWGGGGNVNKEGRMVRKALATAFI